MSHHKDLTTAHCHTQEYASLFGLCQYGQILAVMDILCENLGMAGMWCQEQIVKSTDQRNLPVLHFMPEQTKHFLRQLTFFQTIMVIQSCLRAPAEMNRGSHMGFAPLHDLGQFIPVVHFFKFHLFHRCSGNDHAVKLLIFHLIKTYIKFIQVASGSIFCFMACHRHKSHIDLQWCVGQRTKQLQFGLFFERHQV